MMNLPQRKPPVARLRVSDKVLQTFEYACVMRDFEVAGRLVEVLEHMAARSVRRFGGERRTGGIDLGAVRDRLSQARLQELRRHGLDVGGAPETG